MQSFLKTGSFLLFFATLSAVAQENLLKNSDFEKHNAIPTNIGQGKNCLKDWTIPVLVGGGDYYHSKSKSRKAGTEKNYFGKQEPHSGEAYTGICITGSYREYLQQSLNKPLEKGKKYKAEVYISCADAKWLGYMKGFGIIFTDKLVMIANDQPLLQTPSINFRNEEGYKNTTSWEKLEGVYVADGTEKYLTFGCFVYRERNESAIRTFNSEIPGVKHYAHYYIDDFTLMPLDAETRNTEVTENELLPKYETGKTHIFKNIVFDFGKAELLPSSFDELNELAHYLIDNPSLKATITGHTDNVGNKEDNRTLSIKRAQSILNYLKEKKVSPLRLSAEGKGDTEPIAPNITEENRALNRRVEVVFY